MKKILLVGGAGFIGHHLADILSVKNDVAVVDSLQVNNFVQVLSDFSMKNAKRELYNSFLKERIDMLYASGIKFYNIDARDYHKISKVVSDFQPEIVIHLAAIAHANVSNKNPFNTFDHSLRTLENVLDACAKTEVQQIIYFSSSMVYGEFQGKEVVEEQALYPKGIYGALKVAGELIVKAYREVFGLPYTIIRPSALYGERCISGRVVQQFIESAVNRIPLKIAGDGSEKLDFTYIDDLVSGVLLAIGNTNALDETFNITYGNSRSLLELAEIVCGHFPNASIDFVDRDKLMPKRGTLSIVKANELLKYCPIFPIENGVDKYITWYKGRK